MDNVFIFYRIQYDEQANTVLTLTEQAKIRQSTMITSEYTMTSLTVFVSCVHSRETAKLYIVY